ncbi:MAG: hypothetical protein ACTTJS_01360 [Wolinella sp.]
MRGLENLKIGAKLGEESQKGWSVERLCEKCGEYPSECKCNVKQELKEPRAHRLKFRIEKRNGKSVTCVEEFFIPDSEVKALLKKLKSTLGCGGTISGGILELQGDKIVQTKEFLTKAGFGIK